MQVPTRYVFHGNTGTWPALTRSSHRWEGGSDGLTDFLGSSCARVERRELALGHALTVLTHVQRTTV